jgi:hypothetical protein
VIVTDAGTGIDTLWFGHDPTGDYGLDGDLCEFELPPPPPSGVFDARFVNIPGREGWDTPQGLGQGFTYDYRLYVGPGDVDTHKVRFQPGDPPPGYPMNFAWTTAGIISMCDSAWLVDEITGGLLFKARMHVVSSQLITNTALTTALIIRFGQKPTGVNPYGTAIPTSFALEQNFPNPFNPSTTIRFAVLQRAVTDVSVYDVLGKKVATLASEELSPGYYDVQWNGTDAAGTSLASGMYFVRMTAVTDNASGFSAVRKILYVK